MPRRTTAHEPRGWLANAPTPDGNSNAKRERTFGRDLHPDWKTVADDTTLSEQAALETAKYQHELARQMHARMRDAGLTVKQTAKKCGMSEATLRRFLNAL